MCSISWSIYFNVLLIMLMYIYTTMVLSIISIYSHINSFVDLFSVIPSWGFHCNWTVFGHAYCRIYPSLSHQCIPIESTLGARLCKEKMEWMMQVMLWMDELHAYLCSWCTPTQCSCRYLPNDMVAITHGEIHCSYTSIPHPVWISPGPKEPHIIKYTDLSGPDKKTSTSFTHSGL